MIKQLIPAAANFAPNIRTIIESHVLERNKYQTKFPTMELKGKTEYEAISIKPISITATGSRGVGEFSYIDNNIHGGINFHKNKKSDFYKIINKFNNANVGFSIDPTNFKTGSIESELNSIIPQEHRKKRIPFKIEAQGLAEDSEYFDGDGDLLAPFNIFSSSVTTGYKISSSVASVLIGLDITNIHYDSYGPDNETPMQSPFSEKYVGGRQYRHIPINRIDKPTEDTIFTRPEGWHILLSGSVFSLQTLLNETFSSNQGPTTNLPAGWTEAGSTATSPAGWTSLSGATATPNTGPDSAYDGGYYMHSNASSPNNPNKHFGLVTPQISGSEIIDCLAA